MSTRASNLSKMPGGKHVCREHTNLSEASAAFCKRAVPRDRDERSLGDSRHGCEGFTMDDSQRRPPRRYPPPMGQLHSAAEAVIAALLCGPALGPACAAHRVQRRAGRATAQAPPRRGPNTFVPRCHAGAPHRAGRDTPVWPSPALVKRVCNRNGDTGPCQPASATTANDARRRPRFAVHCGGGPAGPGRPPVDTRRTAESAAPSVCTGTVRPRQLAVTAAAPWRTLWQSAVQPTATARAAAAVPFPPHPLPPTSALKLAAASRPSPPRPSTEAELPTWQRDAPRPPHFPQMMRFFTQFLLFFSASGAHSGNRNGLSSVSLVLEELGGMLARE